MIRRSVATAVSTLAGVLLGVLACCGTARGAVIVEATVTPDAGFYHFDLLITNSGPDDVVLVTLMDAPLADPLIGPSLIVAVGFLGNYDPGLGFVDFLEDTDLFAVGTIKGPFSFDSLTAPGADSFSQFQALTTNGDQLIGCVIINGSCIESVPVPEPASWLLLVLGLGCILIAPVRRRRDSVCLSVVLVAGAMLAPSASFASSHSDAPLIKQDPQANLTDVYAFIGTKYDDPGQKVLNVIVSVRPFSEPGDGVMYERFADDALYSIHITNPVTGVTLERYDYRFSSITGPLKNSGTILSYGLGTELGPITSIGDARQNFTQTYSVYRNGILLASGLPIPPPNVGARTTPAYNDSTTGKAISGATSLGELDSLTAQGIRTLATGAVVWAGPREDGFYADTSGTFDLLDPRIVADKDGNPSTGGLGQDGGGVDSFKGFNVLSYALQIPVASLPASSYTDPLTGHAATGVGVYASVSRPRTTLRRTNGRPVDSGPWIQVNRLGNPLFNEVFVALRDKDAFNRTSPSTDAALATYALNPELGRLINTVLFGDPTGAGPLPVSGRTDLAAIFIPDVVRVNTSTPPVRLPGQAGFSRLGFRGGDLADASGTSGGWPNGRRIGDDVIDIALSALSRFTADIGDNVNANDQLFHRVFPYLGTPHSGPVVDQRQAP